MEKGGIPDRQGHAGRQVSILGWMHCHISRCEPGGDGNVREAVRVFGNPMATHHTPLADWGAMVSGAWGPIVFHVRGGLTVVE